MKQKRNHLNPTAFVAAALAATFSLSLAGMAAAQTVGTTYSYITSPGSAQTAALGGAGTFNNTLVASGYASESYSYYLGDRETDNTTTTSATTTGTQNGGMAGQGNGNNVLASGFDLGTFALQGAAGTDGSVETVVSVTLLFYVTGASITAPNPVISIYTGLDNHLQDPLTTSPVGSSYTVAQSDVGKYISIDIPYSVAFSGFTLGDFIRRNPQDLANYGTEDNSNAAFQPAYRVNTIYVLPVPEPSTALLGALGSLFLLRRNRRNA